MQVERGDALDIAAFVAAVIQAGVDAGAKGGVFARIVWRKQSGVVVGVSAGEDGVDAAAYGEIVARTVDRTVGDQEDLGIWSKLTPS